MRNLKTQVSEQLDTYRDVRFLNEYEPPKFLELMKEHIKFEMLIPCEFYLAYYHRFGRPQEYSLESIIRFLLLQKIYGIHYDSTMLLIVATGTEFRKFCGFAKIPPASKITRFRQGYAEYLGMMFDRLVDITEPMMPNICEQIQVDPKKADYLIYDPTGTVAYVKENNPKFYHVKLREAKLMAKKNFQIDPYKYVYSLFPEAAEANPFVKHQYINGHFCYAHKSGMLTNGIGIFRGIYFFDERFKRRYPEIVSKKTDNPDLDKEIGDSTSLDAVLSEFFHTHPTFSYDTFLADSSFDSDKNYGLLMNWFGFDRACIPINPRNSDDKSVTGKIEYDQNGIPLCPIDKTPFKYHSRCPANNHSVRYKYICHKSERVKGSHKYVCSCPTPCTTSSYGRCVYVYPNKDLRLYPGIPRDTDHWNNLYRHRVQIERSINIFKDPLGVSFRKSVSARTIKADLFFAGISQLIGVILAVILNKPDCFKSIRRLISSA